MERKRKGKLRPPVQFAGTAATAAAQRGQHLEKRPCGRVDGPERARTGFAVDFSPSSAATPQRGVLTESSSPALRGLPTDAVRVGGRTHHLGEWERTAWLIHGFPHDRALFNTAMSAFPEGERNGKKKTRETVGPIQRDVSPGTCPRAASALKEDWNAYRPMGRHRAPGGRDR